MTTNKQKKLKKLTEQVVLRRINISKII